VSDIAEKLADLDQECKQIRTRALALTDKPELSADDRKQIEECIELILEIKITPHGLTGAEKSGAQDEYRNSNYTY